MSEDIVAIEEAHIEQLLNKAHVMMPAMAIGANVSFGNNESLVTDEDVCTVELLILVPTDGDDQLAIMPIIMSPELAESLGLSTTELPQEEAE